MTEKRFDRDRIRRFFEAGLPGEDGGYVEEVVNDGGYDRELKKLMSEQFDSLEVEDDAEENERLDRILHTINYNINEEKVSRISRISHKLALWSLRIAAFLSLPLLVYSGLNYYEHKLVEKEVWVEIKAPAWTRVQFRLPDGTTGWLNSNSNVKYLGNFLRKRQVELTGEAFFDVVKDASRPFTVTTSDIQLEVLGTKFNVASYCDEDNIEVVLEEGSLKFVNIRKNQSKIMKPNDLIVYNKELKSIVSEVVQPKKYLSWTEGSLVFRNDPIDVVARRLARWYNAEVVLKNDIDTNLRLRATFVGENLEEVLNLLKLSLPVKYSIENASFQDDSTYSRKRIILSASGKNRN